MPGLEQYAKQLVESRLLSADEVGMAMAELSAERHSPDPSALARELVRRKLLTPYQAQEIYAGNGAKLLLGNYAVLDKLGQGGMGMVLKAEHTRMKRQVALKVLSPTVTKTPEALQRFQREVHAAAKLNHPNIVVAYDADESNGTHFLVMEYVEGINLATLVTKQGPLRLHQALNFTIQAARGLEYAHRQGVVHRDIKPSNLLVSSQGTLKILDMGLARLDSPTGQQEDLTSTGQIMGTVDYMAPEQARNTKQATQQSDIYSLGVTLWYLLTGKPLFHGETTVQKLIAHQSHAVPALTAVCHEASPELAAVFAKMVAKTLTARFRDMTEVLAALEKCLGEETSRLNLSGRDSAAKGIVPLPPLTSSADDSENPLGSKIQSATSASSPPADSISTFSMVAERQATSTYVGVAAHPAANSVPASRVNPDPLRKKARRILITATGAALLAAVAGVWVIVRDQEGNEVARMKVPEGGTTTVQVTDVPIAASGLPRLPVGGSEPPPQNPLGSSPQVPATTVSSSIPAVRETPPSDFDSRGGHPPLAIAPFNAPRAKAIQAAWSQELGIEVETTNSMGAKLVLIPPGEFWMGSTDEAVAAALAMADAWKMTLNTKRLTEEGERPRHRVNISRPFLMGASEVSVGEFKRFAAATGYKTRAELDTTPGGTAPFTYLTPKYPPSDDLPAVCISWNDAAAYCNWLSEVEKARYRLPTEAEWEYACRAGTTTQFWFGDDPAQLVNYAWYSANSGNQPHPPGTRPTNPFGLHHMHGNAYEWCQDYYEVAYYQVSPAVDPLGPNSGQYRVIRGGNYSYGGSVCRSAYRFVNSPYIRDRSHGFRLVKELDVPATVIVRFPAGS